MREIAQKEGLPQSLFLAGGTLFQKKTSLPPLRTSSPILMFLVHTNKDSKTSKIDDVQTSKEYPHVLSTSQAVHGHKKSHVKANKFQIFTQGNTSHTWDM